MEYTDRELDILNRLGNQLDITLKTLKSNPAVSDKLIILQTVLYNFKLQSEWKSSGQFAKLLMAARIALEGYEVGTSAAAFVGPAWMKLQNGAFGLMKASLSITERRQAGLLKTFNELMSLGAAYIATETLGNWEELFPKNDPPAAKSAGLLLREMGLSFLIHSGLVEAVYGQVGVGLGISEKSGKLVTDIGLFFILMVLILVDAEDNPKNMDLIEAFSPYLSKAVDSVELAVQRAQEQNIVDQETVFTASSQVQLMKRALESKSPEAVKEAIESSFQAFEISHSQMKSDIALINRFSKEMNESFSNIFFQSKQRVTTMTQAA